MPIGGGGAGGAGGGLEVNYTQRTSSIAVASTTEATGTTILSPGAVVFNGAAVMVEFFCVLAQLPSVAVGNIVVVSLFESTTQITRLGAAITQQTGGTDDLQIYGRFRFAPTSGSHTYTVTAHATSTTGAPTIIAGAGGTATYPPCFVRFTYA